MGETVKGRRSGLIFVLSAGSRMVAMLNFVSSLAGGIRRPVRKAWRTMMYSFSWTSIITFRIPWREDTWKILAFNSKLGSFSRYME